MIISGEVLDKNKAPISNAEIIMLDNNFEEIHRTNTNNSGLYIIEKDLKYCPFIVFLKDYKDINLEFWAQNIWDNGNKITINGFIDKIEVYGLTCFEIKGATRALTIYFRPMSITLFKKNNELFPNITKDNIKVSINNTIMKILTYNIVEEFSLEFNMKAILCQIELPKELETKNFNILEILIIDANGDLGNAILFF